MNINVGQVLKEIRKKKGMTQVAVCRKMELTQAALSYIENGKTTPHTSTLTELCALYEVPVIFVIWRTVTEKDIPKNKLKAFRKLKPAIDDLIDDLVE